ncbi:N-acetyl-gamma-glutamyl-phosphate reductase [Nocardia sp. NPDC050793]|uniref:N-acetyl-gamma-glutamyl-phosphate reductase n=1 Tax=Nocardia sp. NPDC050793 TaxID=3155159 RepID=UPI0033D853B2
MTRVSVLGASGYIGGEVLRLLGGHPQVTEIVPVSSSRAGDIVGDTVRGVRNSSVGDLRFVDIDAMPDVDVAIAAMPHGALPERLDSVSAKASTVINVAGDFRLTDPAAAARHYPASAATPVAGAYYIPEFGEVPDGSLVNMPGCMAVAALYAALPLYRGGLVCGPVVIEAKTGSSGGGVHGEAHAQRYGDIRMHRFFGHRHEPEVREAISRYSGKDPDIQFSTVSLPISRGVFVSVYARLRPDTGITEVRRVYAEAYRHSAFVKVRNGRSPGSFPSVNTVIGTNFAEVGVAVRGESCVAVCALDNLIKGGGGQAVQAMNKRLGLPEETGLMAAARWP